MIRMTVLLPLSPISATIAAGPVTYALTPGGGGVRVHDVLDGFDRFVPQSLAQLTDEVQLNIGGLTVGALRGARREGIPPEILDVLHMRRIVFQLTNHIIVVPVSIVAQGLLTLQDDHRHTLGIGFLEILTHALHRLDRWRILRSQRYRMLSLDLLQRGNTDSHNDGDRQPRQDDEHRKSMDRPRYKWSRECAASPRVCCSCGLQQAGSEGVHLIGNPLGFDLIVHEDAAADAVTIALRHDTSDGRRLSDRELQSTTAGLLPRYAAVQH